MPSRLKILQRAELEMLAAFIAICEKHEIRYFLLGGSALGAVRHEGFIPWDDDIDVGIPRADYHKFLSIAQEELGEGFFLQTAQTDPSYPYHFAKIRNCGTTFIQSDIAHLQMNHGVFIDIFPLDGCSASPLQKALGVFTFKTYRAAIQHKFGVKNNRFAVRFFTSIYACFFTLPRLREKIERFMHSRAYDDSDFIVNWCGAWGLREAVPNQFFGKGKTRVFEGLTVTIPIDYDGYLKSLYGDYMTLPPVEKRVGHHFADVIDLEAPCAKYTRKQ